MVLIDLRREDPLDFLRLDLATREGIDGRPRLQSPHRVSGDRR
jgi:hypothetical protein